jgi:alkylation response protein AidB-like acyl-CoA dehydrogenase
MTTLSPTVRTEFFANRADAVDAGETDTRGALERLGADGLVGLDAGGPDYTASFEVVRDIARVCVSQAFSTWAHRMAVEYLTQWETDLTAATLLPDLRRGARPGATAMASALAAKLGLGTLGVDARRDGDEIVLDGKVRWASNLFDDAVVVLPASIDGDRTAAVAVPVSTPGVHVNTPPSLLALDGTASSSLRLDGVRLDSGHVLSTDLDAFLAGIRRPFLLLQSAFCVGLSEAALDATSTDGVNEVFAPDRDRVAGRLDALRDTIGALLRDPAAEHRAVLSARLTAAEVAFDATALEGRTRGGAGYVRTSPTARRLREAAFLPIQSPTEAQLRWELSQSAS